MSQPEDVIVAVMGATGTGKSSFIRLVTGNDDIEVGNGLQSATTAVATYRFRYQGINFVLVDTPGLDDTNIPDKKILQSITSWLTQSYLEGKQLNGILYLHRIIDPRMQGSALRNFNMFRQLCGRAYHKQVILGTTFWSAMESVPDGEATAQGRVDELTTTLEFWGAMISGGSEVVRISDEEAEARKLLLKFSTMSGSTLRIQDEVINQKLDPSSTSAAKAIHRAEIENERASNERDKKEADEKHKQRLETLEKQRTEKEERLRVAEEIRLLRQALAEVRLEFDYKLKEQEMRWKEELLRKELERTAEMEKQVAASRKETELAAKLRIVHNASRNLINQLHVGQVKGTVECVVKRNQGPRIATCAHCSQWFNGMGNYKCDICRGSNFNMCDSCYAKGKKCLNKNHQLIWIPKIPFTASPCRLRTNIQCDRCKQAVLQIYLHCCQCKDDNFDLCIDCATNGKTCDEWTWFKRHEFSICTL